MCLFHPQNTLIGILMLGLSEINPNVSQYSQEVNTRSVKCLEFISFEMFEIKSGFVVECLLSIDGR